MNPPLLSTTETVDAVFWYILGISTFFLVLITVVMLWFVVKYHRKRHPRPTSQASKNIPLEVAWTLIPTFLALSMFWYGWSGYLTLQRVPEGAMEVDVTARMWSWLFEYENGRTSDKLYVPAGQPVRVNIQTADVIHSFYIPAFRVKKDAVPGMTTHVWFTAEEPGSYDIFCAEYCGLEHSSMITTVEALPPDDFVAWLEQEPAAGPGDELKELLTRYGCLGCHSLDGSDGVGPTLQEVWGRQVTVVENGREKTVTADREYLRRAILEPQADLVKGYPPVMPAYRGEIPEEDLEKMLDLFESAGTPGEAAAAGISGEKLMREKGCIGCHSLDGSRKAGPTFQGLSGSRRTVEKDGQTATLEADADYLRRAIVTPEAEIVQGFPPVMPAYPDLSDEELEAMINYLRNLR